MDPDGFDKLVRQAQSGDREAMNRLLDVLRPQIEKIAADFTDPTQAAESVSDLVQEAGLRAWQRLEQFRGGGNDTETLAMFRSWIAQIVRTVGLNARDARNTQRRKAANRVVLPLGNDAGDGSATENPLPAPADGGPTPSAGVRSAEQTTAIKAALERLPEESSREIVRLCFFEGLTLRQISARLNLSYDQVRERYHAALRVLERQLKGYL